jgi:Iap family predicted aminopeptidase
MDTFETYPWNLYPVVSDRGIVEACLIGNEVIWPQPRNDDTDRMPYVMVPPDDWKFIDQCLAQNRQVRVGVSVRSKYLDNQQMVNVVAQRCDIPSVIVGAHYDSFFNTVGAHDNASGTSGLLCLARRLSSAPRSDVCFVSFDAEEWNKLGSYRYVRYLATKRQLENISAMINIDSIGVGESIYLLTAPRYARSIKKALRQEKRVDREIQVQSATAFPEFDTWPFMQEGIPVVQIGTRARQEFFYWHQPEDNLQQITVENYKLIRDVVSVVETLLSHWTPTLALRSNRKWKLILSHIRATR